MVLPRVDRLGHPADGAALAGRVVAFEHGDQRLPAEALVAHQHGQAFLLTDQLLPVGILAQRPAQVEAGDQPAIVQAGHQRCGVRQALGALLLHVERHLQPLQQGAADGQAAIARVHALDHVPRRIVAAGAAQQALAVAHELVVGLALLPVQFAEPPAVLRVLLQHLQAGLELLLRQVEPELEEQRALVAEHPLEALRRRAAGVQGGLVDIAVDPRMQQLAVPVAEEDADLPLGRQPAPETPLRWARELLVARLEEALHLDQARVHPFVEQLDRLALARPFDTVDQDQHREARLLLQLELSFQQRLAQFDDRLLVGFLVDRMADLGGLEHAGFLAAKCFQGRRCAAVLLLPDRLKCALPFCALPSYA
ncbi:hypothetical protein D3C78_734860 [compost metagenome]